VPTVRFIQEHLGSSSKIWETVKHT